MHGVLRPICLPCMLCCAAQDQLIIFMALASGTSTILTGEPTLHTRTAIAVAEQLTGARFQVLQLPQGGPGAGLWRVVCQGAGQVAGQQKQPEQEEEEEEAETAGAETAG